MSDDTGGTAPVDAHWDAIVVGGGPAGSAAAFVLAGGGSRVLVVERRARFDFKFGELLSPLARPLLIRMGFDVDRLVADHAPARGYMSAWGSADVHEQDFMFNPYGDGLRLDRPRFDDQLRKRAAEAGTTVMTGTRLVEISGRDRWRLRLAGPSGAIEASTPVVLDCSGRSATVARAFGVARTEHDRLFAFGARYSGRADDSDPFLRIEAQRDGWSYSMRLPSGDRMVVFHTDADLPAARTAADVDGLDSIISESRHIGPLLREHGYRPTGRTRAAPAGGARLEAFGGRRWLAAGDSALSFDPLSSQGIATALDSGFAAADAVLADDAGALDAYTTRLTDTHADYLRNHADHYGMERRWADDPFWSRRHPPTT